MQTTDHGWWATGYKVGQKEGDSHAERCFVDFRNEVIRTCVEYVA